VLPCQEGKETVHGQEGGKIDYHYPNGEQREKKQGGQRLAQVRAEGTLRTLHYIVVASKKRKSDARRKRRKRSVILGAEKGFLLVDKRERRILL